MVGHSDAQRNLREIGGNLAELLARAALSLGMLGALTPEAENAVMPPEAAETWLFSN